MKKFEEGLVYTTDQPAFSEEWQKKHSHSTYYNYGLYKGKRTNIDGSIIAPRKKKGKHFYSIVKRKQDSRRRDIVVFLKMKKDGTPAKKSKKHKRVIYPSAEGAEFFWVHPGRKTMPVYADGADTCEK